MSNKQPEALRLADALNNLEATGYSSDTVQLTEWSCRQADAAATALIRQHALITELVGALETANEIAQTLESVIAEIDQSGSSHLLGSCYEASKRLMKTWWPSSAAALSKAKEQS